MEKKSVSDIVIQEICAYEIKKNAYFPFISGVIRGTGELIFTRDGFSLGIQHTNGDFMKKIADILRSIYNVEIEMDYTDMNFGYKKGFFYTMILPAQYATDLLERCCITKDKYTFVEIIPKKLISSNTAKRAFLQGLFLACGFLKVPASVDDMSVKTQSGYTLNFSLNSDIVRQEIADLIEKECLLDKGTLKFKKSGNGIYIKNSESICDVLTFMGSVKGVLTLHEIISERRMRNDVNRVNNFDLANIDKSVIAGAKQVDAINRLMHTPIYDRLSQSMKDTCKMRLDYPDMSLEELAKQLTPPISKSCINHRLRKIMELAEDIEDNV